MDTEGTIESAHINRVFILIAFRENVRAFFTQELSKLYALLRCLYYAGVRKAGFDCIIII